MGQKIYVSEKETIGIREFMDVYLGVKYTKDKRLTHREMEFYLIEKGKKLPHRVSLDKVNKNKLANGSYLVVREESKNKKKGKKIIYENPLMTSFGNLLAELEMTKDHKKLKEIRKSILDKKNLFESSFGDVVEIGEEQFEVTIKYNRQKIHEKNRFHSKKGR